MTSNGTLDHGSDGIPVDATYGDIGIGTKIGTLVI